MRKYKGIIFDFNGVLFWDTPLHEITWQPIAERLRGSHISQKEIDELLWGKPSRYVVEYLSPTPLSNEEIGKLVEEKESSYRQLCLEEKDLFLLSPGTEDLLDFLEANSIPHNIATSSEKNNLLFFVEHFQLYKWFDVEKIAYDNGTIKGKPYPDLYQLAAKNIGLLPKDCVIVEDALNGIIAAKTAKAGKIYALGPPEKHDFLRDIPGVDEVITSLEEISRDIFM